MAIPKDGNKNNTWTDIKPIKHRLYGMNRQQKHYREDAG